MDTRKVALLLVLLFILLPFRMVSGDTTKIAMYVGQKIIVNGATVYLEDISADRRAAFEINGSSYVMSFGDSIKLGNLSITLGSVYVSKREVYLVISAPHLSIQTKESNIKLDIPFPAKITYPDRDVTFKLIITNHGAEGTFPLDVITPEGWNASFLADGSEIDRIHLKHGETTAIILKVHVSGKNGRFKITVHAGDASADLQITVLSGKLALSCAYPGKEAEAGKSVKFQLKLKSTGDTRALLKADAPPKWRVKFIANGEGIREINLNGESILTVLINIPSDSPVGRYPVTIWAGNESITLHVYVTKSHAGENGTIEVKAVDSLSGSYVDGAEVELLKDKRKVLSARTTPDGVTELNAPEGYYLLRVLKEGYQTAERYVNLSAGEIKKIQIVMTKLPYFFKAESPEPSKSEVLGKTFIYPVIVKNLGFKDDSYSLQLNVPENWGGMIVEDPASRTGITSIFLKAGEEKKLYIVLIPPDTAKLGSYTTTLRITSTNGKEKVIHLESKLIGSYGIEITPDRYSLNSKAGKEFYLTVKVYNTGSSPLTNIKLDVDVPKGWSADVRPSWIPEIKRDKEVSFEVRVLVPANADAGDYFITLKAKSDQKSRETSVRITVTKGSGQTYVGIGMSLGALIILAAILKKYGRR